MSLRSCATTAAIVLAISPPMALAAQSATASVSTGSAIGSHPAMEPYTASIKSTTVQKLANGTTVTHESTINVAHDSAGRVYHETHHITPDTLQGHQEGLYSYDINDQANRTWIHWISTRKEAFVEHLPEPSSAPRPSPTDATPETRTVAPLPQAEVHTEELGSKTIAGIAAIGTRTTRVIPAGAEGNDQPLTVTDERWLAAGLSLLLLDIHDDPRTGTRTNEVTEVERGEPNASLFQIPEGYSVTDRTYPGHPNR
jgi:hypothetical protein